MKTHVEFRSDQFPPYEGEENETNPGVYGKRLAEFLVGGPALDRVLASNPAIRDKRWWTYEEYNNPRQTPTTRP